MSGTGSDVAAVDRSRDRTGGSAAVVAFASDAESEAVLRDSLVADGVGEVDVRRGRLSDVSRTLQHGAAPRVLIVDISGVDQPLTELSELSQLVEPGTRVLAIGDREDLALYRSLTRGLGLLEYLFKPLTQEMVTAHFVPFIVNRPATRDGRLLRGGRLIAVTGVHGGVGASTIAANLAWVIAERGKRHTLLLDSDLYGGSTALLLSAKPAPGLRTALEMPERVDDLFVERATQRLSDRLHVLACEGKLNDLPRIADGAVARLTETLRRRFNIIVCDAPWPGTGVGTDLFTLADHRILVTEPTLIGARDVLRYLAAAPTGASAPLVVLNHIAPRGDLPDTQYQRAVGRPPDLVIPYMKGALREAANLGEPAAARVPRLALALEQLALRAASVGSVRKSRFWHRS
jgi:pilus assembly protein CpaE